MATSKKLVPVRVQSGVRGKPAPQLQPARTERWNAEKEDRFLTLLGVTGNVRLALRETDMSGASLYKRRKAVPAFRAAWDAALSEGFARLEAEMLARAIHGTIRDEARGESDAEYDLRPLSDSAILSLMAQHNKQVSEYRAAQARVTVDTSKLRREITAKLDRLARSLGMEVKR